MFFDPLYFLFLAPGMILAIYATIKVQTTFAKYSRVAASSGMTGAEAAEHMLRRQGITDVKIELADGFLSDHYDPRSRTLRLSSGVYGSQSLSAIGVACHEAGHALQHATFYAPLGLRTALVPTQIVGSYGSYIFFIVGSLFHSPKMILAGVGLFTLVVLFAIITLPVEWNASSRAKEQMVSCRIVSMQEQPMAGAVLNAAFLTYVASALTALLTLLYYLMRAGLIGGRRND
jgi:Zn-dependent membrane protease YugP